MRTKILLLFAIFFCPALASIAQIKKGRTLFGGSISYYTESNPTTHFFYTNIQVGKVIKSNSVIGIIGSYSSNNYNYTTSSPNKTKAYSAGIFYRKYKALGNNFYFFGEVDASWSYSKNIEESFNVNQDLNSKSSGVALYFIPGISYTVWKRMQVDLSMPNIAYIGYSHITTIDSSLPPSVLPQKNNTFTAGANLNSNILYNFSIGFKFLLGK